MIRVGRIGRFQRVLPCGLLPHLQRNGGGSVVTTAAYSVRAPKILAMTHGADGIRVNVPCPGLFDTEVNDFVR